MISKFLNLDKDKQQRILNAAITEFAQKGFENASTNTIVKEAEISKGLLFHYFKNKKELYLFLYNHFVEIIMSEFISELDLEEKDIFIRIKHLLLFKSKLINKYPEIFNFLMSASLETSIEVKNELDKSHQELLQSSYSMIFSNIDANKFKEGIDVPRAINMIFWTLEGFSNQIVAKMKYSNERNVDLTGAFSEVDIYIEMLKNCLYK